MATSKAAKPSNLTFEPAVPPPGAKAGGLLKWVNNATDATGVRVESSVDNGLNWKIEAGNLAPNDTEHPVGGFEQGAVVQFRVIALKP